MLLTLCLRPALAARLAVLCGAAALAGLSPLQAALAGQTTQTAQSGKASKPGKAAKAGKNAKSAKTAGAQKSRPARPQASDGPSYASLPERREAVLALAAAIAEQHRLERAWVEAQLLQARQLAAVQRLIMPPPAGTAKNWAAYRERFIEPERLKAGAAFWDQHQRWLDAAEQRHGVPAEIIVGIIGVETFYGRVMGGFRVLDALATLSLDFPTGRRDRTPFFRDELGQFLALMQREGREPATVKGSFAGAIGLGQFMPGSINRFAVDFDGDGHVDMADDPADVIGSVAHYLAEHGWQRGLATHFAVKPPVDTAERAALLLGDILPSHSAAEFAQRGAELEAAGRQHAGPLALIELQNGEAAPSHIAGTTNFYAVTRYNWSAYYALAVIELGRAVAAWRSSAALNPAVAPAASPAASR